MERKVAIIQTGLPLKYRGPVSYGVPISLTKTMREMEKGQSFLLDSPIFRRNVTATAKHVGIRVSTRKRDGFLVVTRI